MTSERVPWQQIDRKYVDRCRYELLFPKGNDRIKIGYLNRDQNRTDLGGDRVRKKKAIREVASRLATILSVGRVHSFPGFESAKKICAVDMTPPTGFSEMICHRFR